MKNNFLSSILKYSLLSDASPEQI